MLEKAFEVFKAECLISAMFILPIIIGMIVYALWKLATEE